LLTYTVGDFFEQATAALVCGQQLPLSVGNGYCPDVKVSEDYYIESKGVGRSRRAIIYEGRNRRQLLWCLEKKCYLDYFFWMHNAKLKGCRSQEAVRKKLVTHTSELLVISQNLVQSLLTVPAWQINSGNPVGYRFGWFIPCNKLITLCTVKQNITVNFSTYRLKVVLHT
jgi:hypothetical protein